MPRKIVLSGLLLSLVISQALTAQILCILPAGGEHGIHYENPVAEDLLPWGPSAIAVAPDGRIVVADAARTRLVEYGGDCSFHRAISLAAMVQGITDVKVTADGYFVLDTVSSHPMVVQLASTAQLLRKFPVAEAIATELPSLVVADGEVRLGLQDAAETQSLAVGGARALEEAPLPGLRHQGVDLTASLEAPEAGEGSKGIQRLSVTIGSQKVSIESSEPVASFNILGAAGNRHFYARAIEVTANAGLLKVRESVYRLTFDGQVDGVVHGLFAGQYVFVPNRLAVDASRDRVLALLTYSDRAEIHQLAFSKPDDGLGEKLSEPSVVDEAIDPSPSEALAQTADDGRCKAFPKQIRATADGYINNLAHLTEKNIVEDGTCERRAKPHYLGGAANYASVPYDWGGFDTVADFNNFMTQGKKAGDTSSDAPASCSKGVDCSGFVSRTWQLTAKEGSATIGRIATALSDRNELRFGDILNRDSFHVVLIDSVGTMVNVYEATTDQKLDRVVRRATPWGRYDKYKMLRYNNYCEVAASQIGCVGSSPQLFADVPVNLTGGVFSGPGHGNDYNGSPLYFKVNGNYDRKTRNLEVTLAFYTDASFSQHVRTDRCVGALDTKGQFLDEQCDLIQNTSAGCPIFLSMSLQGESRARMLDSSSDQSLELPPGSGVH